MKRKTDQKTNVETYAGTIINRVTKTKKLRESYFGKSRIKKSFVREEI